MWLVVVSAGGRDTMMRPAVLAVMCVLTAAWLVPGCSTSPTSLGVSSQPQSPGATEIPADSDSDQYGQSQNGQNDPSAAKVKSITIYANYTNGVRIGRTEKYPLRAEITFEADSPTTDVTVRWESCDERIFAVASAGSRRCEITGVAVGTAQLRAAAGSAVSDPLNIHVQSDPILPPAP